MINLNAANEREENFRIKMRSFHVGAEVKKRLRERKFIDAIRTRT